jgi:electron transport complex protein RnfG
MSKKESTFTAMTLSLLIITLIAGVSLGFINDITKGPKAKVKLERKVNSLKQVLPEFNNDVVNEVKLIKLDDVKDSTEIYTGAMNGDVTGTAIIGSTQKGFSGLIKIMVGFLPDGSTNNISVLEQKETPGLGTKIKDEKFIQQFRGQNPAEYNLKAKKDGGDIDALTGATITTRAFGEATQQAYDVFINNKK